MAAVALDLRPWSAEALGFRARRLSAWLPTGVMYALFYCSRYATSTGAQSTSVREGLGLQLEDFAMINTCGFWVYAATAPATGKLCGRLGVRRSMLWASIGCITTNLSMGLLLQLGLLHSAALRLALVVLHSLGFALQGLGTAAATKLSSALYWREERGIFAGVYNVMISSGYFLALGVSPSIASSLGFAWVFLLPAAALCLVVLAMLCTLQERLPSRQHPVDAAERPVSAAGGDNRAHSLHQRRIRRLSDDSEQTARIETESRATVDGGQLRRLLTNPTFMCFTSALACTCWVRDGLLTYLLNFVATSRGTDEIGSEAAALIGGAVTLGGCVGGVLSGLLSDHVFEGRRAPPILLFTVMQMLCLGALWLCRGPQSDAVLAFVVFVATLFVLGNYTTLSYAVPADLPPAEVGLAAGVMTAASYLSSGFAAGLLGSVIEAFGYGAWMTSLVFATALGGLFVLCGARLCGNTVPVQPVLLIVTDGLSEESAGLMEWQSGLNRDAESSGHAQVRYAGIQDEFLRSRIDDETGELTFHQWGGGRGRYESDSLTRAERLIWRIPELDESPRTCRPAGGPAASRLQRPIDDHVSFLRSRMRDPTSYFAARPNRYTSPY
jgi:sugar phosphate permease